MHHLNWVMLYGRAELFQDFHINTEQRNSLASAGTREQWNTPSEGKGPDLNEWLQHTQVPRAPAMLCKLLCQERKKEKRVLVEHCRDKLGVCTLQLCVLNTCSNAQPTSGVTSAHNTETIYCLHATSKLPLLALDSTESASNGATTAFSLVRTRASVFALDWVLLKIRL